MTRSVEIRSTGLTSTLVVDGQDISNLCTSVDLHIDPTNVPTVTIHAVPDAVLYSGPADVSGVPLDGIERLRQRLGR